MVNDSQIIQAKPKARRNPDIYKKTEGPFKLNGVKGLADQVARDLAGDQGVDSKMQDMQRIAREKREEVTEKDKAAANKKKEAALLKEKKKVMGFWNRAKKNKEKMPKDADSKESMTEVSSSASVCRGQSLTRVPFVGDQAENEEFQEENSVSQVGSIVATRAYGGSSSSLLRPPAAL